MDFEDVIMRGSFAGLIAGVAGINGWSTNRNLVFGE